MNFLTKIRQLLFIEQNVSVLSLTVLFILIAFFSWYPVLPIYLQELGANDFQVGFSYTLLALSYTLMQFLGGILSDQFGRKLLIIIPSFLFPLLYFLAGNSSHWITLILFLTIANSLSALQLPSFYSMIAESVPKTKRGIAYSEFELFVVLGITIGPAMGMILIPRIEIKYLFYLTSLTTFFCALARLFWLKETHHQRTKINKFDSFKNLFNKKMLRIILALSSLFLLFNLTTHGPFISLYAKEIMNLDKSKINLLFALGGFAAVIYSLWGGKIIAKWGSKKVLSYSASGLGIFIILWSLSSPLWLTIALFTILYIFFQSCYIAYGSFLADITHRQSRGLVIGFIGTCTGLIGSIGPSLGGYLKFQFGPLSPFWAGLIFALITSLLLIKIKE
ncbi:MFS transporter [bacterium]|nr:MFS transporter [bacterium]MBU4362496.1 MFS transporter [bacterium]MBU4602518.1 MFS transporter [bacterium]MCG2761849.1 MFS transporter [Candidatus Atribacteria bacterium]MCG2821998.1 MFS transporter [Candidatus Atribacteria bacterium]